MQETQVQSLGWEDPLEKEMAIHTSILAWEIPWTEGPGGLQSMGLQITKEVNMTYQLNNNNESIKETPHSGMPWPFHRVRTE